MLYELKYCDLVVSDAPICDKDFRKYSWPLTLKLHGTQLGFINNWVKTRYIGACMAFKRHMLSKILPFPSDSSLCAHDY